MELGNFEQCIGVLHDTTTDGTFNGKYCLAKINFESSNKMLNDIGNVNKSISGVRQIYFPNELVEKGGAAIDIR